MLSHGSLMQLQKFTIDAAADDDDDDDDDADAEDEVLGGCNELAVCVLQMLVSPSVWLYCVHVCC